MPEAQTLENTPESIINPKKSGDRISQIVAKHFNKSIPDIAPPDGSQGARIISKPETKPIVKEEAKKEGIPPVEKLKEEVKVEAKEEPKESDLIQARKSLIRRENQIRKQMEELKAFQSQKGEFDSFQKRKSDLAEYDRLKKLAMENPTAANEALGITYDRWTKHLMSEDSRPRTPEALALDELKKEQLRMKEEIDSEKKRISDDHNRRAQEAFINQTTEELKKDVDKYSLLIDNDRITDVVGLRAEHYVKSGKLAPVSEPASLVESWYEKTWMPKIAQNKKLQNHFISLGWSPPQSTKVESKPVVREDKSENKTLTTDLTTASAPKKKELSKDREKRLLEIMQSHAI